MESVKWQRWKPSANQGEVYFVFSANRSGGGKRILDWVHGHHPELDALYDDIYAKKSRAYWTALDQEIREYTAKEGMLYIRDDDQHRAPFGEPPVVCNYFYHEEITKSAKREK